MAHIIRLTRQLSLVSVIALLFFMQVRAAPADEILVTTVADSVGDDGECTLREAIQAANTDSPIGGCTAGSGADTIHFAIPGTGPHTIQLQADLPEINAPVVIDGYTQDGAQENTNPAGESINAVLMIVIDGNPVFQRNGLSITGGDSTVRGLVMNNLRDAIRLSDNGNNKIEGNFIGTDTTGTSASRNSAGVLVESSSNVIGGTIAAARNIISGNHDGVSIEGDAANFNAVQGNFIGIDFTGTKAIGNTRSGVAISILANNNTIEDNVISGNSGWGILIEFQAANTVVIGNWIGTNPAGANLGNELSGIHARNSGPQIIGGQFLGTGGCCEGNTIAYNGRNGVSISAEASVSWYKGILGNRIYANEGLGIDLGNNGVTLNDPGDADGENDANHLQNFPVLNTVHITGSNTIISGTLNSTADTGFRLEFFANDACDPTGYGEGQRFLGAGNVATQADGDVSFTITLTGTVPGLVEFGNAISATATTGEGDTSEFSQCVQATGDNAPLLYLQLPLVKK